MKKIFVIAIIMVSTTISAQNISEQKIGMSAIKKMGMPYSNKLFGEQPDTANIPKNNKSVWEYANIHMGLNVGNGICSTFVDSAVSPVNANWDTISYTNWDKYIPYLIDQDSAMPGDIVVYERVVYKSGLFKKIKIEGHIGIVHHIEEDGSFYYYSQNVGDEKGVVLMRDGANLKLKSGYVFFIRPY